MKDSADLPLRHEILDWHRRIRQLCPKNKGQKIQLFDRFGVPLTPQQELDQITEFFDQLYCDPNFHPNNPPALTHVPFIEDQIRTQLQRLPMTKALAPDGLPALIWRHFVADLAPFLWTDLEMFWCHDCSQPPAHWTTGWIHLLPKPLKPPNRPEALRPICLQHPMNKILTGLHCQLLRQIVLPQICRMPLYAYLPGRSAKDCLLINSDHCQQVRNLRQGHHKDAAPKDLWGGLQVSLDLEKAFDAVSRNHVLRALEVFDMNPDLRNLITSWLMPHEYCLPHKELLGRIRASRGIKQGAKDAPLLWIVCIYLFCHELLANHDLEWIRDHVIFADDLHFRWIINSVQDGLAALHDLSYLIFSLQTAGFRVNPKKSACG